MTKRFNDPNIKELLSQYSDQSIDEWATNHGVAVFPEQRRGRLPDDGAHKSRVFTLGGDDASGVSINTYNCVGVVKLWDKATGNCVQLEIGSRFDDPGKPYFLTYLLSRVFGGSIIETVDIGQESLWDMLLAFSFRRRILAVNAVGLFKQYRTFAHNDARIRGHIDVDRHLRSNIPFIGRVAHTTHEISFDTPTNHLIRHTMAKVAREWSGLLEGHALIAIRHQLEQNTPTWQSGDVLACIRCKENLMPIRHPYFQSTYEPLRQVSLSILRDEGASIYQQHQEAEGVLFDGAWLWEEYLWTLLEPLNFEHPENKLESGGWDTGVKGVTFYPDFFHPKKLVVLDAKYKFENTSNSDDAKKDVKQLFDYMFILDAVHGGLIKPNGESCHQQPINRQSKNAKAARWHDLAMSPVKGPDMTWSSFRNSMRKKEEEFKVYVRREILGGDVDVH